MERELRKAWTLSLKKQKLNKTKVIKGTSFSILNKLVKGNTVQTGHNIYRTNRNKMSYSKCIVIEICIVHMQICSPPISLLRLPHLASITSLYRRFSCFSLSC